MSRLARLFDLATWQDFLQGSKDLATPDVTKVQALALGQAVIVVLIVLGVDLDTGTQQLLLGLSAAIGAGLPLSDAVIRNGRASNAEQVVAAKQAAATDPAEAGTDALGLTDADREGLLDQLLRLSGPAARPRP